jgi:hypothetical protein
MAGAWLLKILTCGESAATSKVTRVVVCSTVTRSMKYLCIMLVVRVENDPFFESRRSDPVVGLVVGA